MEALRGPISAYLLTALDSADVDLRMAAGEAVALLYETADDDAALRDDFYDKIKALSTDSNKYRSKRDRKEQRSTFREVLKTIEGEEDAVYQAKTVKTNELVVEKLVLATWSRRKQYDLMRKVLSMDVYLQRSPLIRETFEMGPPQNIEQAKDNKPTKQARVSFGHYTFNL